ncbi:MAG: fatty acyl-AMP ligase, partial [bacterium]
LGIAADADVSIILASGAVADAASTLTRDAPALAARPWLATDRLALDAATAWRDASVDSNALAFLQYTSGSTAAPKGVMVSHANLLHNLAYAEWAAKNDERTVSVSWLPVIHDMGLIEGVLGPLYGGYRAYLMAPASFLQRPIRWLRAITRYRATTSGGPNFAYDLCARKVGADQLAELDLRSWRIAYNGAEPIRAETLHAFHARFCEAGFRWSSFYPVYGLAESTLLVSTGGPGDEPVIRDVDAEALSRGRFRTTHVTGVATKSLVSSGPLGFDTRVVIADPETGERCTDGRVGEIWVSSPSVARGYWRREVETRDTFDARLATGEGPFLRTGDLGIMRDGELFVTGRIKDVLIVRGLKHYPQDLELTAERQDPAIRAGCSAAFSLDAIDGEAIAIAMEVDPRRLAEEPAERDARLDEMIGRVRQSVAEQHGIVLSAVSVLSIGAIPKTSSGKLRRRACRAAFIDGSLRELARWSHPVAQRTGT